VGGPDSIRRTLWQALKGFQEHQLTDVAAALTYYATMSLFPGVLLALTLLGVLGDQSLVQNAADYITRHGADPTTTQAVKSVLHAMVNSSDKGLGIALLIALVLGLNSISGAFAAAGRALNRVFSVKEDRGFVHQRMVNLAIAAVVLTLVIVVLASMFLGGQIADDLFENTIGLGSTAAAIWSIARFPLALFVALLVYGLVYAYAPDVKPRKVRVLTPGAVAGVSVWILASVGFFVYVKNLSHYGTAYGIAGAMIILLLWLWLGACAFLLGAEINVAFDERKARRRTAREEETNVSPEAEPAVR
jgi:membrane protein